MLALSLAPPGHSPALRPLRSRKKSCVFQDLGVQISDEQAAKLAGFRFQVAEAEDAKLPTESEKDPPPPGNLPTDMDLESPPGLQPSNPNKERNGRSRSPKGGDGDKGKPGDNKV